MENFIYFVSYSCRKGEGMIRISTKKPIESYDDVLAIAEFIERTVNETVVIVNWIPLEK